MEYIEGKNGGKLKPIKKGEVKNRRGRPRGSSNKVTKDVREAVKPILELVGKEMLRRLRNKEEREKMDSYELMKIFDTIGKYALTTTVNHNFNNRAVIIAESPEDLEEDINKVLDVIELPE